MELDNPPIVNLKNEAWKAATGILQSGAAAR
jgi:hypothetical protein